ncbi:MAG: hypothetical protein EB090_06505, partial [Verrucomicrobia bacterium]|nr:hypothetical protein [Verrucomicrobiota bacterium]
LFLGYSFWAVLRAPCEYFARLEWLEASVYGAVFLTVRHQLPGRKMVPWVLVWLLLVAVMNEVYGFLHFRVATYPIGPVSFLGWEAEDRANYAERMSGLFGCPNHFGNYMVQAGLAGLTLLIWPGLLWPVRLLTGWLVAGFGVGVIYSISRGSLLAWLAGFGVGFGRWLRRGPLNRAGKMVFLLAGGVLLVGAALWVSREPTVMNRWNSLVGSGLGWEKIWSGDGNFRFRLLQDGLKIWRKAPWFGNGPGSFDLEHLRVTDWSHGSRAVYTHNDYVNTLADYGAVGAGLVALFWIFLAVFLWQRGRTREPGSKADTCTGLGWALMTAMMLHALVDFNFHIPATAVGCFFLLGIATTVSWPERRGVTAWILNPLVVVLSLVLAAWTGWQGWRTWAGRSLPTEEKELKKLSEPELGQKAAAAEKWDPRSPIMAMALGDAYRLKLIGVYFSTPSGPPEALGKRKEDIQRLAEASARWYREAAKRSPRDDVPGVRLASILDLQGKFDEAESLYQQALRMRPHSQFVRISYGNHLWRKGDLVGAQREFEKALANPGLHRPGEGVDPALEAREMLEKVKELIAKSGAKRQSTKFNPRED